MIRKLTYEELLQRRKTIDEYQATAKHPISIMLNNIRSMYNVGTIFRTCDSAAVSELILTGYTPYPPRIEIEKTALGAVDTVKWQYEKDILTAIAKQKADDKHIVAVELTNTARSYNSLTMSDFPLCLILGNELVGIDDDVLAECDDAIEIPMYGVKHSLNVGVAAGIAIYEAVKAIDTNR
ncbi:MAG: RNA methyltransferase [Ignavibacteria bacterium]|jgi:tRNA G18 (ribose-2'-O)-methylase SpoU|nr:RNA methyltransferase [Ignavibacteria bacterium]